MHHSFKYCEDARASARGEQSMILYSVPEKSVQRKSERVRESERVSRRKEKGATPRRFGIRYV